MDEKPVILPAIFGALTTITVVTAIVVTVALTDFLVQSFTLLFVIPVGAVIAGAGCGIGVFLALWLLNRRPAGVHYWMSALFAAIGFAGTYLALYLATYLTGPAGDLKINYSFTGVALSSLVSFPEYLRIDVASRETSFFAGFGHVAIPVGHAVDLGATVNWLSFALEPVGYILGGLLLAPAILWNKRYCQTCKLYMKSKYLFRALLADVDEKIERINSKLSAGRELRELVAEEKKLRLR